MNFKSYNLTKETKYYMINIIKKTKKWSVFIIIFSSELVFGENKQRNYKEKHHGVALLKIVDNVG